MLVLPSLLLTFYLVPICQGEQAGQEGGDEEPGPAVPPAGATDGGGAGTPHGWQAGHHTLEKQGAASERVFKIHGPPAYMTCTFKF